METESKRWKLGDDVSADDNILDGFTFRDLILAVHCNCENITPEAVRREAAEILEERMQDYRFLLRNNYLIDGAVYAGVFVGKENAE